MTVHFFSGTYLKSWPNWSGVIPQIGDTVILHFGDYNEKKERCKVVDRIISGIDSDSIVIHLDGIDKK